MHIIQFILTEPPDDKSHEHEKWLTALANLRNTLGTSPSVREIARGVFWFAPKTALSAFGLAVSEATTRNLPYSCTLIQTLEDWS